MTEWYRLAACAQAGVNPDLFLPFGEGEARLYATQPRNHPRIVQAVQVCGSCPVRTECLQHGQRNAEAGVWGGTYLSKRSNAATKKGAA